jgi:hypothetical protein
MIGFNVKVDSFWRCCQLATHSPRMGLEMLASIYNEYWVAGGLGLALIVWVLFSWTDRIPDLAVLTGEGIFYCDYCVMFTRMRTSKPLSNVSQPKKRTASALQFTCLESRHKVKYLATILEQWNLWGMSPR